MTLTALLAWLSGDLTTRTIPMMPPGQRRRANAHQPTDSGLGVPQLERRDGFLAPVKTIEGGRRQDSKLFIPFDRPDLYTDYYSGCSPDNRAISQQLSPLAR
ncbi:MAG: hypothetical protein AAGD09_02640 [Cyanobacteria bacterium P01_F01_bin.56]